MEMRKKVPRCLRYGKGENSLNNRNMHNLSVSLSFNPISL